MKINSIYVDGIGRISASQPGEEIVEIKKNGEMASVIWYKLDNTEYNSKYVVAVTYSEEEGEIPNA